VKGKKVKRMDKKRDVLPVMVMVVIVAMVAIVLVTSLALAINTNMNCLYVYDCASAYAANTGTNATVLNTAPAVVVKLAPDDDPVTPGVQVINPDPGTNKTVTITANVTDMNGYDDLTGMVIATITGPGEVEDSPVSLKFYNVVNQTTATYTGSFNMSNQAEGEYEVEVNATDNGGLAGVGSRNFTYSYSPEIVTTYDFTTGAGTNKWAYGYQYNKKPPASNDVPDIEFERWHYKLISRDEGMMKIDFTRANGYYAIHRFKFDIAEPETRITKLDVLWDGMGYAGWGTRGATLYIWNFKTGKYEKLDRKTDLFVTLRGSISDNIGDYIDDNTLIIIAEQNSPQWKLWWWMFRSYIGTDYVKVNVTYTPTPTHGNGYGMEVVE